MENMKHKNPRIHHFSRESTVYRGKKSQILAPARHKNPIFLKFSWKWPRFPWYRAIKSNVQIQHVPICIFTFIEHIGKKEKVKYKKIFAKLASRVPSSFCWEQEVHDERKISGKPNKKFSFFFKGYVDSSDDKEKTKLHWPQFTLSLPADFLPTPKKFGF